MFPTQTISKEELMSLQVTLPLKNGPGYYAFTVTDAGGAGEDAWMVKLSVDPTVPQQQEGYPMAGPGFPSGPAAPMMPLDADVKQISPGWFFNESLGFLTTPWRETVAWRIGEPLPKPPASAGHLTAVPATATPWNWQQPMPGGWGGYPVGGGSSEIDALKAELAEANRRREMDELKADQRRRDEEQKRREEERDRKESERIAGGSAPRGSASRRGPSPGGRARGGDEGALCSPYCQAGGPV